MAEGQQVADSSRGGGGTKGRPKRVGRGSCRRVPPGAQSCLARAGQGGTRAPTPSAPAPCCGCEPCRRAQSGPIPAPPPAQSPGKPQSCTREGWSRGLHRARAGAGTAVGAGRAGGGHAVGTTGSSMLRAALGRATGGGRRRHQRQGCSSEAAQSTTRQAAAGMVYRDGTRATAARPPCPATLRHRPRPALAAPATAA